MNISHIQYFRGILSVPQNIVMDMNNVIKLLLPHFMSLNVSYACVIWKDWSWIKNKLLTFEVVLSSFTRLYVHLIYHLEPHFWLMLRYAWHNLSPPHCEPLGELASYTHIIYSIYHFKFPETINIYNHQIRKEHWCSTQQCYVCFHKFQVQGPILVFKV